MRKFECEECEYGKCTYVTEKFTRKPYLCPLTGKARDEFWMEVTDAGTNTLPKLTVEVFERCPKWGKYLAVDADGKAAVFMEKPEVRGEQWVDTGWRDIYFIMDIPGTWDASDWQNSLVERPAIKLPKLTLEALAEYNIEWPEGARYAAVNGGGELCAKGVARFYENKPDRTAVAWFDPVKQSQAWPIPGVWDASDWTESVIERPAVKPKVPEWCVVGAWVWWSGNEELAFLEGFGKIIEINSADGSVLIEFPGTGGDKVWSDAAKCVEARVRPWTFEEAPEHLKVKIKAKTNARYPEDKWAGHEEYLILMWCSRGWQYQSHFEKIKFPTFENVVNDYEMFDGSPCGVLEVVK